MIAREWDQLDGTLLPKGIDLLEVPLDRALNVVHALLMSTAVEEKDRFKLESALNKPLPIETAGDRRDDFWAGAESDGAAFLAAMGQGNSMLGGRAPRA
ncbi:hypothetical protein [Amycolatopsis thermophila]|uniref:Uncharacterized protein n=1 Tax=Amycolatopsis thermophila TaxID=206084 RepID=A0ABU0EN70_9PSEU|nr:hypothetical protein [Amycolatopsis thermophila]MDQ0376493.1 hypothetical protein [Amycolatopsis thermophila]